MITPSRLSSCTPSSAPLTIPLRAAARLIDSASIPEGLAELRLRSGRRAIAVLTNGALRPCSPPLSANDIADCFEELTRCSVHSFSRDIAQGFITIDGGCRVGICGTAVCDESTGAIRTMRDISSLNIRLAREVKGCAQELYSRVFSDGLCSLLLGGRPLSGKTTVLRDLARILGERFRVVIIDSRNELSASVGAMPTLDIGENTDALVGCGKGEGIMLALRSLSPQVIICDEIGGDYKAVEQCMFCGVKIVAAAHAASREELCRRADTAQLLPLFDKAAILCGTGNLSEVWRCGREI